MPPKKENKAGADGEVEGEDPMVMQSNYTKFCKSVGLAAHTGIVRALADEEKYPIEQLIVDDEFGLLGPGKFIVISFIIKKTKKVKERKGTNINSRSQKR